MPRASKPLEPLDLQVAEVLNDLLRESGVSRNSIVVKAGIGNMRGDTGRQDEYVESFIDEIVALRFVNSEAYAKLETAYGCEPGVIAEELDLPRWVIEAWQRLLNRTERLWERSA